MNNKNLKDFSSHSFCEFTFSTSGLLLFSFISCTRSSPVLFVPFFFANLTHTRLEIYLTTPLSALDLQQMYLITGLTGQVVDFDIIFNIHITLTFLLNVTKEERLLALTNLHGAMHCASQWLVHGKEESTLFHTYSSTSLQDRRQIQI